jgi:hypothetical protein
MNPGMNIEAQVVHRIPGRLRLRLPAMRGDAGFFDRLRADFDAALPDHEILVSATTGSVLITGAECPFAEVERIGREHGWFELGDFDSGDRPGTASAAAPGYDARSTTIFLLLLLASVQILRGQVLVPATSLLWYAYAVAAGFLPNSSS